MLAGRAPSRARRPAPPCSPPHSSTNAWLRFAAPEVQSFENRAHSFGSAAEAMRRILIESARRRSAQKHGSNPVRVALGDLVSTEEDSQVELMALDEALDRLANHDPRAYELEERVRVDLVTHANWAGAYTTNGPAHITMASVDEDNAGWNGVETLMHEACHTSGLDVPHRTAVERAFAARGVEALRRFWHALVFYTAGELTRVALAEAGSEGFRGYREAFDAHWRPYLAGTIDRAVALERIIQDLP
ncbi:MAG: hypothetical protein GY711_30195 [bacterium]|nr:hypothetical protein [bacterium]